VVPSLAAAALLRRPLRSFLTALGIAIAVGSTVVFLSLGEGLRRAFTEELRGVGPDLQISFGDLATNNIGGTPELPTSYLETLRADADRFGLARVTPLLIHVRSGLAPGTAVVFQGLPADVAVTQVYVDFEVERGRALGAADAGRAVAVAGPQVIERAGIDLGDELRFNPRISFEVVGVASGVGGLLDSTVLVPLVTRSSSSSSSNRRAPTRSPRPSAGRTRNSACRRARTY